MPETRLGAARAAWIAGLSLLTVGVGLGRAGRLTYHEAFVAQAAREMIARGDVLVPTIGGRPWLEKPPLPIWLVALSGRLAGLLLADQGAEVFVERGTGAAPGRAEVSPGASAASANERNATKHTAAHS